MIYISTFGRLHGDLINWNGDLINWNKVVYDYFTKQGAIFRVPGTATTLFVCSLSEYAAPSSLLETFYGPLAGKEDESTRRGDGGI